MQTESISPISSKPTSPEPISPQQLAANRANSQLSTGPCTEAGKNRSRQNAMRHGLTGRTVLLPGEDLGVYREFSREIVESLRPETPVERQFAQTIADSQWRLNRIRSLEDGMLAMAHDEEPGRIETESPEIHNAMTAARAFRENSQSFVNLSIYEQRIHRVLDKTLRQLQELQEKRRAEYKETMDDAVKLHKHHVMTGRHWDPVGDGFVYSRAEIDAESARRTRREKARIADLYNYDLEICRTKGAA